MQKYFPSFSLAAVLHGQLLGTVIKYTWYAYDTVTKLVGYSPCPGMPYQHKSCSTPVSLARLIGCTDNSGYPEEAEMVSSAEYIKQREDAKCCLKPRH